MDERRSEETEATGRNGQYQFRYVILLNETEGWAVSVGGEDGMETLEKIARNLEIRVTDKAVDFSTTGADAGYFMIGRG
ncbi:MAG: hypothetical protein K6G17_06735 [Oscillospiraceae bacterium]|nr:hypothetical protein [Oscillospiraceae bacterium]